jgi:hypothetical protein
MSLITGTLDLDVILLDKVIDEIERSGEIMCFLLRRVTLSPAIRIAASLSQKISMGKM